MLTSMQKEHWRNRLFCSRFIFLSLAALFAGVLGSNAADPEPNWIWAGASNNPPSTVFFRKQFRTPPLMWNSRLVVSADDEADVYLNGFLVAKCEHWDRPVRMETTVRLNQGNNVIAIQARNRSGPAGLLVHLSLGGEKTVQTDSTWLVSTQEETGWTNLLFNASTWTQATVIGPHGIAPWGQILGTASATAAQEIKVANGFSVELLRSAQPGEGSWINLAFDDKGRLLVSPQSNEQPLLRMTLSNNSVEKIEPVAATLHYAMGLLWANGGLYANAIGPKGSGLYRAVDKNKNDIFDADEVTLLVATKGSSEHGYHAVRQGPDGKIYVLNGNGTQLPAEISKSSPHKHYAQDVLALGETENELTQPSGYILRGNPDGTNWELFLGGLRNTYDFDFNADGELLAFDSDMEWDWGTPWYRPTRILHCVSGAEYGWREDRRMWPEYYEDSLPAVVPVGIGSPTGVEFGTRSNFPDPYRAALFAMDWSYGRILAVHLKPAGASYKGEVEQFLQGTPLNLTDLTFGPDGAMYFITGGRGTQSGLYKVSYKGPAVAAPESANRAGAEARALRRQLEKLHGKEDPESLDFIWSQLGNPDRFLRYAARIALESQPPSLWQERALKESHANTGLTALLALARAGDRSVQSDLLKSLQRFPLDKLNTEERLLKYRIVELSFLRQGRPAPDLIALAVSKLDSHFPAATFEENRELVRLLTWLEAPSAVNKTMSLLETAKMEEEQIHYIEQLRRVRNGWTPELRQRYFAWWTDAHDPKEHPAELRKWFEDVGRQYVDGAWMDKYLREFRDEAATNLTPEERREFGPLISQPIHPALSTPASNRSFVKAWTMEDFTSVISQPSWKKNRDIGKGRRAFVEAQCLSCHRFGNDGGVIGPELTAAGSKYDARSLLESILEPSKVINEQYRNMVVRMKDGEEFTGKIMQESSTIVEVETDPINGTREKIKRDLVQIIEPAKTSPMPEGLVSSFTKEEILDLVAYLQEGLKN